MPNEFSGAKTLGSQAWLLFGDERGGFRAAPFLLVRVGFARLCRITDETQ